MFLSLGNDPQNPIPMRGEEEDEESFCVRFVTGCGRHAADSMRSRRDPHTGCCSTDGSPAHGCTADGRPDHQSTGHSCQADRHGICPLRTSQELQAGGNAIAAKLTELTGYSITVTVPTNYAALVEAMGSGNAQVGFLPTWPTSLPSPRDMRTSAWSPCATVPITMASRSLPIPPARTAMGPQCSPPIMMPPPRRTLRMPPPPWLSSPASDPAGLIRCPLPVIVVPTGFLAKAGVTSRPAVPGSRATRRSSSAVYLSPNGEMCDFGASTLTPARRSSTAFPDVNDKVVGDLGL